MTATLLTFDRAGCEGVFEMDFKAPLVVFPRLLCRVRGQFFKDELALIDIVGLEQGILLALRAILALSSQHCLTDKGRLPEQEVFV